MTKQIISIIYIFIIFFMISCSSSKDVYLEKNYNDIISTQKQLLFDSTAMSDKVKRNIIKASTFQQQGKYANAIIEYQEALQFDSSAYISFALASSYYKLQKIDQSKQSVLKTLSTKPDFIPGMELLVQIYLQEYDLNNAITVLNQMTQIVLNENHLLTLASLYEFNNADSAIATYKRIPNFNNKTTILQKLIDLYQNRNLKQDQISTMQTLHEISHPNFELALNLVNELIATKEYGRLLALLKKFEDMYSEHNIVHLYNLYCRAIIKETHVKYNTSISDYLQQIDMRYQSHWKLMLNTGTLAFKIIDLKLENAYFKNALKFATRHPTISLEIAYIYQAKRQMNKAIKLLKKYSPSHKEDARFDFLLANAYLFQEKSQLAIDHYYRAISIQPKFVEAWLQIGLIYDSKKLTDSSDHAYEKGLEISPNHPIINNNYAYSLVQRNLSLRKALYMSSIAIKTQPNNPSFLDTYAWINFKMGKTDLAIKYLKKALQYDKNNFDVYLHLGDVYFSLKDLPQAEKFWMAGLKISPSNLDLQNRINSLK